MMRKNALRSSLSMRRGFRTGSLTPSSVTTSDVSGESGSDASVRRNPATSTSSRDGSPRTPRHFTIYNDTWLAEFKVRFGGTYKDACKWAYKTVGQLFEDGGTAGGCVFPGGGWFCLWLPDDADESCIAHEALHVVYQIMQHRGNWPPTVSNQESYTYLLQWVVKQVTRRIKQ